MGDNPRTNDEYIELLGRKKVQSDAAARAQAEEERERADRARVARQRSEAEWERADRLIEAGVGRRAADLEAHGVKLFYAKSDKRFKDGPGEWMVYWGHESENVDTKIQVYIHPQYDETTFVTVAGRDGETLEQFQWKTANVSEEVEVENMINALFRHSVGV